VKTNANSEPKIQRAELPLPPQQPVIPQKHPLPQVPRSPRIPQLHLSPLSTGQELEKQLKTLADKNAVGLGDEETEKRWQLARDERAVELAIERELTISEQTLMLDEWIRLSMVDSRKREEHLAAFLVEVRKVRVPTGDGDTVNKAVDRVSKLSSSELVQIPGIPNAPESWRRVATMHREMFRLTGRNVYFLSCRDAAKSSPNLTHQTANNINSILVKQRVIEIVEPGTANRATRYRYLHLL
jgi:hypothetical protein